MLTQLASLKVAAQRLVLDARIRSAANTMVVKRIVFISRILRKRQNPITSVGQCRAWLTTRKFGNERVSLHHSTAVMRSHARRLDENRRQAGRDGGRHIHKPAACVPPQL